MLIWTIDCQMTQLRAQQQQQNQGKNRPDESLVFPLLLQHLIGGVNVSASFFESLDCGIVFIWM